MRVVETREALEYLNLFMKIIHFLNNSRIYNIIFLLILVMVFWVHQVAAKQHFSHV